METQKQREQISTNEKGPRNKEVRTENRASVRIVREGEKETSGKRQATENNDKKQ